MLAFFHNSYTGIGGIENLIFNIAAFADKVKGEQVKIFGPVDSYLYERLQKEKVRCIFFDMYKENNDGFLNDDDIVIMFSYLDCYKMFRKSRARVVIWNVLTYSIIHWNRMDFEKKLTGKKVLSSWFTRRLVRFTYRRGSFICMDGDTMNELNEFMGYYLNYPLIPVPIPVKFQTNQFVENQKRLDPSLLKITYVARGTTIWKIYPIERVVKDLEALQINYELHIYTNETRLYDQILTPAEKNRKVVYHLNVFGEELQDSLLTISDLHFGMGTSALEGAVLGIPTVLLDPSNTVIDETYKYDWVYEKTDYSLGHFITNSESATGSTMAELLHFYSKEKSHQLTSYETFNYVLKNHSLESVYERIIKLKPDAMLMDVLKFTPNSWAISKLMKTVRSSLKSERR
jgi:hypothetical protein